MTSLRNRAARSPDATPPGHPVTPAMCQSCRPGMAGMNANEGKDGQEKIFCLLKLRSMSNRRDANGELLPDAERLGKYGRFIRSTSLDELPSLIENKIDLLLCNADEAAALTGIPSPEEIISLLVKLTGTVVIKMGEHGSLIASKTSNIIRVPAIAEAPVIDTTAAGDHYAAGFFFGLAQNAGLELCGQYGAYLGGAIATVSGSRLPEEYWQKFFKKFDL